MLAHELLPETLTEPCMDVLKQSSPSERELIRVIVEMIAELRDGEELLDAVSLTEKDAVAADAISYSRIYSRTPTAL